MRFFRFFETSTFFFFVPTPFLNRIRRAASIGAMFACFGPQEPLQIDPQRCIIQLHRHYPHYYDLGQTVFEEVLNPFLNTTRRAASIGAMFACFGPQEHFQINALTSLGQLLGALHGTVSGDFWLWRGSKFANTPPIDVSRGAFCNLKFSEKKNKN